MRAYVEWPSEDSASVKDFQGRILIEQKNAQSPTTFHVYLRGFPDTTDISPLKTKKNNKDPFSLFGFHIHTNPIKKVSDLKKTCGACGGHFNPLNVQHGSKILSRNWKDRHVGDLINNIYLQHINNPNREVEFSFTDNLARLIPTKKHNYSIIGKSIVVHQGVDDLGLQGRPDCLENMYYYKPTKNKKLTAKRPKETTVFKTYNDPKLRKESLANGNAGARIACGNIRPLSQEDGHYYESIVSSLLNHTSKPKTTSQKSVKKTMKK